MQDHKSLMVFIETSGENQLPRAALELLGLGQKLAAEFDEKLAVVLAGKEIQDAADAVSAYADTVFLADHPALARYDPESYLDVLEDLCEREKPSTFLISHTAIGQDLAPRLSFTLMTGLITDCVRLSSDAGGNLLCTKPIYGGNALVTYAFDSKPRMVTVRNRVGEIPDQRAEAGEIIQLDLEPPSSRLKMLGKVEEETADVKLEEAQVIVSGGRGIGGPEGFEELRNIAALLAGAIGASRPPCDAGWINTSAQVGITGKVVAPDLYLAVAISGSSQHLSGMSDAGTIVAINSDPDAYIFKVAHYGVVGDWKRVLPAFSSRLKGIIEK